MTKSRYGITLLELVVGLGIIGVLAAILLPAIQSARESARRTQCQNNMKQTSLAALAFHGSSGTLPSLYNGTSLSYPLTEWDLFHMHSWRVVLLPYIEQQALHDSVAWQSLATEPENKSVATTVVSTYICPSGVSPSANLGWALRHGSRGLADREWPDDYSVGPDNFPEADVCRVVRSDYGAMAGMLVIPEPLSDGTDTHDVKHVRWGVWGSPVFDNGRISAGSLVRYRPCSFADISDGLSKTIMFVERGGHPFHMVDGKIHFADKNPDGLYNAGQVGWSASNNFNWSMNNHTVGINHDNYLGIYSTHAGGANVSMADGSVSFLSESMDVATLARMYGRSDGSR